MTHWFHAACGALMRPEPFSEALAVFAEPLEQRAWLEREAGLGVRHRRVSRARAAGRAASGRSTCRQCREPIVKDAWRVALAYYEDGRFAPSGFIHVQCAAAFFETTEVMERLRHFTPDLTEQDVMEIQAELSSQNPSKPPNPSNSSNSSDPS